MEKEFSLEELSSLTGEDSFRSDLRFSAPLVKFNGVKNTWTIVKKNAEGKWIEEPFEVRKVVVLKIRRILEAYGKMNGEPFIISSNETNTWKDPLVLFEREVQSGKSRVLMRGNYQEVKSEYPELRLKLMLYCLVNDSPEIVRIGIKGRSLANFFEYLRSFGRDEHLFQFFTEIGSHSEKSGFGFDLYSLDFVKGQPAPLDLVINKIIEVSNALKAMDENFSLANKASGGQQPKDKLPVIQLEESEQKQATQPSYKVEEAEFPF